MRLGNRNVLESTKMDRLKLISIVQANLEQHKVDFQEAKIDFAEAMVRIAEKNQKVAGKNLKLVRNGTTDYTKLETNHSYPTPPVSYENAYKKALRMLELSVEDTIDIPAETFNQLVLDEWDWKDNFVGTMSLYKSL